jgi:alpha-1,2-mannosyltransferase
MHWWIRFDHLLNPRRTRYAFLAGGALWLTWLLSILLGRGNMDMAKQVVGTDYLAYYTVGTILRGGDTSNLYNNMDYLSQIERNIIGPELTDIYGTFTPPYYALLYIPFTFLPYRLSFAAWSLFSLLCLWLSLKLLEDSRPIISLIWALTFFPIFATISFGENSLLSVAILCLTYTLWHKEKKLAAGLACSLLLYKPQLILGVGLLWLLDWHKDWKALLGLTLGGSVFASICFWLLPDASRAYIAYIQTPFNSIYWESFPIWHDHVLRAFWLMLLPGQPLLDNTLTLVLSLVGVFYFIRFWLFYRNAQPILFAGAICLTIWITPHAMIYDWALLIIPAVLLFHALPEHSGLWKAVFALIWIATFISGPLTYVQLQSLHIAIQISIPLYALVLITVYSILTKQSESQPDGIPTN